MQNYFKDLSDEELAKLLNDFLKESKDKRENDGYQDDEEGLTEGYRMLSGKLRNGLINGYNYNGAKGTYNNIMLPAYTSFAPSHGGSKPPDPTFRALIEDREELAVALGALSQYSIATFDYTKLTTECGMDAFFSECGVGYARHRWNDAKGIAETTRFDPKNVYWQAGAGSIEKASYVIEKHKVNRGEFIKKFGTKKGWKADACKDGKISWPKKNERVDGKTLLDKIEYYLCWSKEGGYKRVYAFTNVPERDGILNKQDGEPGEEWPIELADDDWHLTPLKFMPVPGIIDGISFYWAGRDQYTTYQRLNTSTFYTYLKCGKVVLFVPDELGNDVDAIEKSGKTVTIAKFMRTDIQGPIKDNINVFEMPAPPPTLLQARNEAKENWRNIVSVNATTMLESQNLETATEAKTLRDSAQNMIAYGQGAVERFWTDIIRKETFINLSRMPKNSVLCVKTSGYKEEPEGEFEDEPGEEGYEKNEGEEYIFDVPPEEAVLLEKGPKSIAAAGMIAKARQKVGDQAAFQAATSGAMGPQLEQAQQQAQEQVPQTPEMAARAARGIPMDAVVKIVNPGVSMFIGAKAAEGWIEGLSPRQIESEIGISVEPGSASATSRMQAVNEVLMLFNTLSPLLVELGLYEPLAELMNAAIKKSEIADLNNVRITLEQIQAAVQQKQQAAQQQAEAEAQAKAAASQGPTELNPNDQIKAEAEITKSQMGLETQKQKTEQQQIKLQSDVVKGDVARNRTRSQAQLAGVIPQ